MDIRDLNVFGLMFDIEKNTALIVYATKTINFLIVPTSYIIFFKVKNTRR